MDTLFRLNAEGLRVRPGVKVLTGDAAAGWLNAKDMLEAFRQRQERLLRKAEDEARLWREKGYAEGRAEGQQEYAEKMLETVLSSVEFLENIELRLVDVVTQSVRKIIGDLNDDERIVRIVQQALHTVRQQQNVTLRVAVGDEKALTEALAPMLQGRAGAAAFLHIVPDTRLERGSCLLESALGVVDAGVETQLKALEKAFHAKVAV